MDSSKLNIYGRVDPKLYYKVFGCTGCGYDALVILGGWWVLISGLICYSTELPSCLLNSKGRKQR